LHVFRVLPHLLHSFVVLSLMGTAPIFVHSQMDSATPEPAFEVVSLRPTHFTLGCYSVLPSGTTHYRVTCVTLRELIARAWKVHPDNIQGGDSAALNTVYSVSAITPNGLRWNQDNVRPMLRRMLEERLHVKVRTGTKQVSGEILLISKSGSKLKAANDSLSQQGHSEGESFSNSILPGYIRGRNIDLNGLAALLSAVTGYPVIDGTEVPGNFDVDLHFAKDGDPGSNWPSFSVALKEQLGLELKAQKVSINILFVDHADKTPIPN
jgi:uncharacterized protein (TIGR03435 family)